MIAVFDIKRQNKSIRKELDKAIAEVIDGGVYILGAKVSEFEVNFAKYIGTKYGVGVASGTDALMLALLNYDIGAGHEVILPANAYPSAFAITSIGAKPKLVDINPETYNINPNLIEKAITKKTKAIIAVHIYGQPCEISSILEIGKKYKIPVIEDCAQAHGAGIELVGPVTRVSHDSLQVRRDSRLSVYLSHRRLDGEARHGSPSLVPPANSTLTKYNWRKVGSIGDIGCFSFYPTKNLGCFGDGGMIVTNSPDIYKKLKLLRMYGEEKRYNSIILGRNSRLDEIQAAILLVKLKYLDKWNKRRRDIATNYELGIRNNELGIRLPKEIENITHVYHLYVIRAKQKNMLKDFLQTNGIGTAIHYPVPIHLIPAFKYLGYRRGDFPESEMAADEILSLPMYPELTDIEIKNIAGKINQFYAKEAKS